MGHTLLHQILVADLVAPVMFAEYGDMATATATAVRLGGGTWVPSDLTVYCAGQRREGFVEGPPLLAVEVASEASRASDLGAKKALYEAAGVPCYWVVDAEGENARVHVFELGEDGYGEVAVVGTGETVRLTEPFKIEITPEALFRGLPPWRAPVEGAHMARQNGPDLPAADEAFGIDSFLRRWPTGVEKVELHNGSPVFYGRWDERDVAIAQRAYPGRVVRLDQVPGRPGTMTVLPAAAPTAPQAPVRFD
ncbi:hypothetical protein GCM10022221_00110 [Actinocorallia aurea]